MNFSVSRIYYKINRIVYNGGSGGAPNLGSNDYLACNNYFNERQTHGGPVVDRIGPVRCRPDLEVASQDPRGPIHVPSPVCHPRAEFIQVKVQQTYGALGL
jgi:hypothetical protein